MAQLNFVFSKPPIIDTEKFDIWSKLFECHVRGKNTKMWEIIEKENFIPTKIVNEVVVKKETNEFTPSEESHYCLNFEAKNMLYAALTSDEIERVITYETANEIWQSLNDTHRGNTQVKSSKINILVHDYELFEMSKDESIDSMFKRFNLIMTTLKGLGRTYPNEDYVRKILRALPSEWMQKITSLEDSRDLSTMKLDDLIGNLKVHEIALKRNQVRDQVKKKSLALKASISKEEEEKEEEEEASCSDDESENLDDLVKLVRKLSKLLSNKKFANDDRFQANGDYRRDGKNPSRHFHKREDKNDESSDDEKVMKKKGVCYVCGDKNHYANVCPKRAKAFVGGAWSASENDDENFCLMADRESEVSTSGLNNYDSDYSDNNYDSDNDNNLDLLYESFHNMAALANKYKDEISNLKETVSVYEKEINEGKQKSAHDVDVITKLENKLSEKDICKSCIILNDKIACFNKNTFENIVCTKCDILENENACLKAKCDVYEKDNRLANAFQSSNDKVLKMLKMSNRINCRKGVGSDTCKDKCFCMPIKRYFESPKVNTRNQYVQKPPYVPKMNYVNYMSRKSHAFMYNNKVANPKKNVNPHTSFYVYDQYNRQIKMVRKWIPKGMFTVDNPGGMRLWF